MIDEKKLIKEFKDMLHTMVVDTDGTHTVSLEAVITFIEMFPTIQPQGIDKKGYWFKKLNGEWYCSVCDGNRPVYGAPLQFCPHCGVKMEGEKMGNEKLIIDGLELIEKINNWRNQDFADSENYTDRAIRDVLDSVIEMIYDMDTIETQGWILVKDLYRFTKNGVCASNGCKKGICTDCSTLCMVFDQLSIFENAAEQGRLAFLPQPYKESEEE